MFYRPATIAVAVLAACGLARAEAIQVGQAEIQVPPGWSVKPGDGGKTVTLSSPDKGKDAAMVLVVASMSPAGQFAQSFATFAGATSQKNFKNENVTVGRTKDGFLTREADVRFSVESKETKVRLKQSIVAVAGARHFVGLSLVQNASGTYKKERAGREAFEKLVAAIRLKDLPAATLPPTSERDLDGLYGAFGLTNQINAFGGLDLVQTKDYYFFLPGGFVFRDLPPADQINKPDAGALKKSHPHKAGTYSIHGGKITLTFADNYGFFNDRVHDWKEEKNAVKLDQLYRKLGPVSDRKLDGVYRHFNYTGGNGVTGTSGGVATERFLTLRPDGTYEQEGIVAVAMSTESGDTRTGVAGSNKKPKSRGTYTFDRYTMTLTPEGGGEPTRMSAFLPDGNDSDGALALNDTMYLKRKKGDD